MKKDRGSDSLFRLVHSLDATEKGYVKKFLKRHSGKGNVNLDLTEALEKQSEYDEAALKKKFKNLAVVKVQTWDEVMDALRIYNKKELTFEKNNITDQVAILLKKGLRNEAQDLHSKYIKKYTEEEEFIPLINLIPTSIDLYVESRHGKKHENFFYEAMTDTISTIEKLKEKTEYHREAGAFYYLQADKNQENYLDKVKNFKKNSILFDKEPKTKTALQFFYDMNAFYYSAIGDSKRHLLYIEKSNVLVNEKCIKQNNYGHFFLFSNSHLIGLYILAGQYEKAQNHINFINSLTIGNKWFNENKDTVLLQLQLALYNRTKEIKSLGAFIQLNEKSIISGAKNWQRIEGANQYKIDYVISLLLLEKHIEALRWILECDNDKTFKTGDTNYQLVLLIEIVLNYVLGDWETAQKEAKKHAKQKEYQFLPLFQALAISDKKKREDVLAKTMNEIQKAEAKSKSPKSFLLMEYFKVSEWIRSVLK